MNINVPEFAGKSDLTAHYVDVSKRLRGAVKKPDVPKPMPAPVAAPVHDQTELIAGLVRDKRCLEVELRDTRRRLRESAKADRMLAETRQKVERLELDLADARARILTQAEMLKTNDRDFSEEVADHRRSVPEIVAEVLRDYPGVTWEDVKGIRRTRELISPRQACMKAVFEERKDLSLPRIGRIFQRDHTTILHAIRKTGAERGGE